MQQILMSPEMLTKLRMQEKICCIAQHRILQDQYMSDMMVKPHLPPEPEQLNSAMIMATQSKRSSSKSQWLLDFLPLCGAKWDSKGRLMYKDCKIGNLADLVGYATKVRYRELPPEGWNTFVEFMMKINVPRNGVANHIFCELTKKDEQWLQRKKKVKVRKSPYSLRATFLIPWEEVEV